MTERILFPALLIKAVALACTELEGFSGFYVGGRYDRGSAVHVGMAVALRGGGLVAPALLDTATKPLDALMREFRDLVTRARAGRLRASELSAPTIVLTSLGDDAPVETVLPIIQPPQVAIVGAHMDRETLARRVLDLVTEIAPDVDAASVLPGVHRAAPRVRHRRARGRVRAARQPRPVRRLPRGARALTKRLPDT